MNTPSFLGKGNRRVRVRRYCCTSQRRLHPPRCWWMPKPRQTVMDAHC